MHSYHSHTNMEALTHTVGLPGNLESGRGGLDPDLFASKIQFLNVPLQEMTLF